MHESCTYGKSSSWSHQATPYILAINGPEEKTLDLTARRPFRQQPGGQNSCVVAKERVACLQISGKIGKGPMSDSLAGAIDDKEAGLVAACSRGLSHEMGWQCVVEEIGG
jgi:hypothetical protein